MIDKDEYIAQLEARVTQLEWQLKAEQDAGRRIVDRMCKAMGRWEGPWDNAAEARLKAHSAQNVGP